MIDLDKLHDLPYLTFPAVVRDAFRANPQEGSWSSGTEFYKDLNGTFVLAPEMALPVELGGGRSESWENEAPFDYVDL